MVFAKDVTSPNYVFKSRTTLVEVWLPKEISAIGRESFYGCTSMSKIGNGKFDNVTTIGALAFNNTSSLKQELTFPVLTSVPLNNNSGNILTNSAVEIFNAPNLTALASGWGGGLGIFGSAKNLRKVKLGKFTEIQHRMFDSSGIEELPDMSEVLTINYSAFNNCTKLGGDLILPKCTIIKAKNTDNVNDAFISTKIKSVYAPVLLSIGDSVSSTTTNSDHGVFVKCNELKKVYLRDIEVMSNCSFSQCTALESFIVDNVTPPAIGTNVFYKDNNLTIYVPDSAVDAYKSASNWTTWASRIKGFSAAPASLRAEYNF